MEWSAFASVRKRGLKHCSFLPITHPPCCLKALLPECPAPCADYIVWDHHPLPITHHELRLHKMPLKQRKTDMTHYLMGILEVGWRSKPVRYTGSPIAGGCSISHFDELRADEAIGHLMQRPAC